MPPVALVLTGIVSVQLGAALAKGLFPALGPGGTVLLRLGVAAVLLGLMVRLRLRRLTRLPRRGVRLALLFGLILGGMNVSIYVALERIPLGVAVAVEFLGPLMVALAGSRRALDALWALLAGAGVLMLSGALSIGTTAGVDTVGLAFALVAGGCWAAYIVVGQRLGNALPPTQGLAIALVVATVALAPLGVAQGGGALLRPDLFAIGAAVAVLSSVIPYSLELLALRRMPARVFGVLMSLEPGVAALLGFLVLREVLRPTQLVAILLITTASVGATALGGARGDQSPHIVAPPEVAVEARGPVTQAE